MWWLQEGELHQLRKMLRRQVSPWLYVKSNLFQVWSKKKSECFATCELQNVSSELREKCILKHSFVIWCDLCCSGAIRGASRPPRKCAAPLLQRKHGTGSCTPAFTPACTVITAHRTGQDAHMNGDLALIVYKILCLCFALSVCRSCEPSCFSFVFQK